MDPEEVTSKADLVRYLAAMSAEAESFENGRLDVFLEAASGWLDDADGYFANRGEPAPFEPSWSLFAMILAAASGYD